MQYENLKVRFDPSSEQVLNMIRPLEDDKKLDYEQSAYEQILENYLKQGIYKNDVKENLGGYEGAGNLPTQGDLRGHQVHIGGGRSMANAHGMMSMGGQASPYKVNPLGRGTPLQGSLVSPGKPSAVLRNFNMPGSTQISPSNGRHVRNPGHSLFVPTDYTGKGGLLMGNLAGNHPKNYDDEPSRILGNVDCIAYFDTLAHDKIYCQPSPNSNKKITMTSPNKFTGYLANNNQVPIMDRKGDFGDVLCGEDETHMSATIQSILTAALKKGGQSFLIMGSDNKLNIFRAMAKLCVIVFG